MSYTYPSQEYSDLIDYILDTYNPVTNRYDNFYEWLTDVKQHFKHHWSKKIGEQMQEFWSENDLGPLGKPEYREDNSNANRVYNSVIDFGSFSLGEAYKENQHRKGNYKSENSFKAGIRRDIGKLVKEGSLEKIGRGENRLRY